MCSLRQRQQRRAATDSTPTPTLRFHLMLVLRKLLRMAFSVEELCCMTVAWWDATSTASDAAQQQLSLVEVPPEHMADIQFELRV